MMHPQKIFDSASVKVWQFGLSADAEQVMELRKDLDSADITAMKSYGRPELQNRFVVRRSTLRRLLALELGIDVPKKLRIKFEEGGKPWLEGFPVHFSISSSGQFGLVAVSAHCPIGVDIEIHNPKMASLDMHFLASEEINLLKAEQNDTANFFRIWARKESVIKATGDGMSFPLKTISVLQDVVMVPEPIRIQDLDVGEGYSAAFAMLNGLA
jgi:4'-phosphopantetheinyl transferase